MAIQGQHLADGDSDQPDGLFGTSISGWGRSVLLALLALGVDGRKVFRDCGLDPDAQGRSLVRNPVARMQYVWRTAEASIDDRSRLATEIVKYLNASSFHALGFGLYASSTVADLFERLCRYREIISSSVDMRTVRRNDTYVFSMTDLRPVQSPLTCVVMILFILRICRQLGGPEVSPRRISVACGEEYAAAFGEMTDVRIAYDEPIWELVYDEQHVHLPLPSGHSQLASFQDKLCQDYLESLEEHRHLASRARLKILQALANADAGIEAVAASLHMSARTLQRKLRHDGTDYRSILREVRKELAHEYAGYPDVSATQAGYMLGYSGSAQFAASFRRWFGESFTAYRARHYGGAGQKSTLRSLP